MFYMYYTPLPKLCEKRENTIEELDYRQKS